MSGRRSAPEHRWAELIGSQMETVVLDPDAGDRVEGVVDSLRTHRAAQSPSLAPGEVAPRRTQAGRALFSVDPAALLTPTPRLDVHR
jgi:hypothetical protein